jgi:hypothetical protein
MGAFGGLLRSEMLRVVYVMLHHYITYLYIGIFIKLVENFVVISLVSRDPNQTELGS